MKNALNSVKVEAPRTNAFDLTHDVKLTCNMGELIPVLVMDLVPGDRVRISNEAMVRFLPMLAPIMHRVDVSFHTFFVPNRLVWSQWETWISNGGDDVDPVDPLPAHPELNYKETANVPQNIKAFNRLMDFMGLPNPVVAGGVDLAERVSALPFAAYQMIYNEYYRDENLNDKVQDFLANGVNGNDELYTIRQRCWEADYFTKALPFAQKGQPVEIPLGLVELDPSTAGTAQQIRRASDHALIGTGDVESQTSLLSATILGTPTNAVLDPNGTLSVGATTINDLRLAFRLQEWLEKNARGGTRYSELIRSHFGVRPLDARLQRPEYVCGTKTPVQISEVLNTTSDGTVPQGEMAGHGISYTGGKPGKYFATEHGYLMTIMSIMPKTGYMQGIPKHFLKFNDPTQLYWPSFAHLGEQEVLNKEIYAFQGTSGGDTFGYQARYQEYKSLPNRACTQMQTTLNFWNMVREFSSPPALNSAFVTSDPTTRIFAVEDGTDHIVVQVLNSLMAIRPMPVYGTPTF